MVILSKTEIAKLDTAFDAYLHSHGQGTDMIEFLCKSVKETLEESFKDSSFQVSVNTSSAINMNSGNGHTDMFVMSVYPEISTVNKIVDALMNGKDGKTIQKLWKTNKNWRIEFDCKIFDKSIINFEPKELTAMLLHEVGHIIDTNSIPSRLSVILRYEIAKAKYATKGLLASNIFKSVMSLPVFDACVADNQKTRSSIKAEIKADNYVKIYGYQNYLSSALTKLIKCSSYKNSTSLNDKMSKVAKFSISTLDDLQARRNNLAKKHLLSLRESVSSDIMKEEIDNIIGKLFDENEGSWKTQFIEESADKAVNGYVMNEFFTFGGSRLKKIEMGELEYIDSKIREMKSDEDRAVILSYISSKIDLVLYYQSLLRNPKSGAKYKVPHTPEQLMILKTKLLGLRQAALHFKIPMEGRITYITWPGGPARALYVPQVDWPDGYEG